MNYPLDIRNINLPIVKEWLRLEEDDNREDDTLLVLLESAKSYIQTYLNVEDLEEYCYIRGENGEILKEKPMPREFSVACLCLIAFWWERRDIITGRYEQGKELPYVFKNLLDPHRMYMRGEDYYYV